mgnify:FL=1
MSETISILTDDPVDYRQRLIVGSHTIKLAETLPIDDAAKAIVIDEAMDILSHCVPPGRHDDITNIAVGYVQSGKTMSFTVLSALAADNGYRIIIYLTGTKTNLQGQTYRRLRKDLLGGNRFGDYKIFDDNLRNYHIDINRVKNFLDLGDCVLLFPILKHYQHISELAEIFGSVSIKSKLNELGVLIIDDEADQSSFNTYARKNSQSDDWEEDEFSKTYASILKLKSVFPSHSYVQYTATPQAAFLISNQDILSPKFHTVLTPGNGYTGGKFFFKNETMELVKTIPDEEVYHYQRNPLNDCPQSLLNSLREFIVSVAIKVCIREDISFLTMMIHPDGLCASNEKFANWVDGSLASWRDILNASSNDFARRILVGDFRRAYDEITKYVTTPPSFDEVMNVLNRVLLFTHVHLIQSISSQFSSIQPETDIDWEEDIAHILIGADMLNRGFTVEHLSMTYMPRSTKGRATADTIEQRCRFFGYKMKYADVCRVYLPQKSIQEYNDYVDHEEVLRSTLRQCSSLKELSLHSMQIANTLNPTRTNILSKKLIRSRLFGWRQMISVDYISHNNAVVAQFLESLASRWNYCHTYEKPMQNHRYADVSIDEFLNFFSNIKYMDVPNITRKIVTIQYLTSLREKGHSHIRIYEIAFGAGARSRSLTNGKFTQLFQGNSPDWSYPGDRDFKSNDMLSVQIHHLKISNEVSIHLANKELYNLAIYYPEIEDYISLEEQDDDED